MGRVQGFMYALMTCDAITVLAYLDRLAFKDEDADALPEEIDRVVDAAQARPVRWYMTDFSSAVVNDVPENKFTLRVERESDAPVDATLYLSEETAVCCYAVQGKAVLGTVPTSDDEGLAGGS